LPVSFALFTASAVILTGNEKKKEFCKYGTAVYYQGRIDLLSLYLYDSDNIAKAYPL
jgi:hypothetical protein